MVGQTGGDILRPTGLELDEKYRSSPVQSIGINMGMRNTQPGTLGPGLVVLCTKESGRLSDQVEQPC